MMSGMLSKVRAWIFLIDPDISAFGKWNQSDTFSFGILRTNNQIVNINQHHKWLFPTQPLKIQLISCKKMYLPNLRQPFVSTVFTCAWQTEVRRERSMPATEVNS